MKLPWWLSGALCSALFFLLSRIFYSLLNELTSYNPRSYDFGGANTIPSFALSLAAVHLLVIFLTKKQRTLAIIVLWVGLFAIYQLWIVRTDTYLLP